MDDMSLVRLAEPFNVSELVILQSLLEGNGIAYWIRHAYVSSLYPGIPALNPHILVEEHDYLRAECLLQRLRIDVRDVSGNGA
jgi:putative signal transducing protein